ncbi:ribonuclease III [Chlorobaculum sp. MV4-Y]|uniref:ribonuclease III n=1 Tax=Chlorobaculum sp. MV4-Y TaxID=2976335 RepID=UPI0021B06D06|nr:ribonuclease III [Chlorobaculum sp. MV4-Y]UWX57482.1 ribonuclease III [Chlorobaculum sp. MV4-Y]
MSLPFLCSEASDGASGTPDANLLLDPQTATHLERLTGRKCNRLIYRTALTHRSVLHDHHSGEHKPESNQRLEFLGDAVLDLLISEHLFKQFPGSDEGHLSSNRAKIVNRKSLAAFARELELGKHLIIGESADKQKIRTSESALADAIEALVGAIYLDQGLAGAERFITNHVIARVDLHKLVESEYNYKSRLIEYTQSRQLPPPLYTVIAEEGAEHEKTFVVEVSCNGQPLGKGTAPRKKDAEQLAAREAMIVLDSQNPFTPVAES